MLRKRDGATPTMVKGWVLMSRVRLITEESAPKCVFQ